MLRLMGEYVAGAAKEAKDAVAVTLGTGVGTGIIIDGKIYSGCNYAGAEMGHMVIVKGGRPCTCGREAVGGLRFRNWPDRID